MDKLQQKLSQNEKALQELNAKKNEQCSDLCAAVLRTNETLLIQQRMLTEAAAPFEQQIDACKRLLVEAKHELECFMKLKTYRDEIQSYYNLHGCLEADIFEAMRYTVYAFPTLGIKFDVLEAHEIASSRVLTAQQKMEKLGQMFVALGIKPLEFVQE